MRVSEALSEDCKVQNEFRTITYDTFHFAVFTLHIALPIWLRPKTTLMAKNDGNGDFAVEETMIGASERCGVTGAESRRTSNFRVQAEG